MDGQDGQDFSGDGGLAVLDICESAPDHRPSRLLVQEALVLLILCIDVKPAENRFSGT